LIIHTLKLKVIVDLMCRSCWWEEKSCSKSGEIDWVSFDCC